MKTNSLWSNNVAQLFSFHCYSVIFVVFMCDWSQCFDSLVCIMSEMNQETLMTLLCLLITLRCSPVVSFPCQTQLMTCGYPWTGYIRLQINSVVPQHMMSEVSVLTLHVLRALRHVNISANSGTHAQKRDEIILDLDI